MFAAIGTVYRQNLLNFELRIVHALALLLLAHGSAIPVYAQGEWVKLNDEARSLYKQGL